MKNAQTSLYLAFTYGLTYISWTIYAVYIYQVDSALNFSDQMGIFMLLGLMAPTLGAYVALAFKRGPGEFKSYHKQFYWNFGWRWLLCAIGLPVLLGGLGYAVGFALEPEFIKNNEVRAAYTFFPALLTSIAFGGLEELGWRGLLLPNLLARFGYFRSTLLVGVAWTLWHIPLFFIPGSGQHGNNFAIYLVELVGYSAILTWLYMRTRSVIAAVLFHASFNAISYVGLYAPKTANLPYAVFSLLLLIIGFSLVARLSTRPKTVNAPSEPEKTSA